MFIFKKEINIFQAPTLCYEHGRGHLQERNDICSVNNVIKLDNELKNKESN